MTDPDIIIDETDTAALFLDVTSDGRIRFAITGKDHREIAFVELLPERAEDIARMVTELVEIARQKG